LIAAARSFLFVLATAPADFYTLSLHDALPISYTAPCASMAIGPGRDWVPIEMVRRTWLVDWSITDTVPASQFDTTTVPSGASRRSEEHTSELQSRENLVCRLLLEKKKENE